MASAPRQVDVVRIGTGAEDLRIARLEIADPTSELDDLGRADEGEIHRPIEYDPPFAREASVRDLLELASVFEARDSHEPELRELVANGQHLSCLLPRGIRRFARSVSDHAPAIVMRQRHRFDDCDRFAL